MFRVFYSWQSDLPSKTNRGLIQTALERACRRVASADAEVQPVVDRDTLNTPGAPDIGKTIFEKIADADAFAADVSIVNLRQGPLGRRAGPRVQLADLCRRVAALVDVTSMDPAVRPTPNPNVLVELGYAMHVLGNERILLVMNTHYGGTDVLPFDLRQLRTLTYVSAPNEEQRAAARNALETDMERALQAVVAHAQPDGVSSRMKARTLNVAGQAEGLLRELIKAAGMGFDPHTLTREQLDQVCAAIDPNGQAPLVIGGNAQEGWKHATWLGYMAYQRDRSQQFTNDVLFLDRFLSREHVGLLAEIEQCPYFSQLAHLRHQRVRNTDLSWLASSLWEYAQAAQRLREFAEQRLRK